MSKLTKAKGNMYDWVTHTHSHLGGECPHKCGYCYVQAMAKRFPVIKERYSGPVKIIEESLNEDYGQDKVIFIDHLNDLFASEVKPWDIRRVLTHCKKYPENQYVFQTKNPIRYFEFREDFPKNSILGTTIESNIIHKCMENAPKPMLRIIGISEMRTLGFKTFVTIEPILKFDADFGAFIRLINPSFVNIGADSKGHGLSEPNYQEIMDLYKEITNEGIEVRKKINLERLKNA